MDEMLKFLDCTTRKLRQKALDEPTLKGKTEIHVRLRRVENCRVELRKHYYAFEDYQKDGEDYELSETKNHL